jgi:hypothetical protein
MNYLHLLTEEEKVRLDKIKKVIVWGFPLHSHTHSYIHAMWVKVFKEGFLKDSYWFHDEDYPEDFDYSECLFITEGYADTNIPINDSSVYFVHNAIEPEKYIYRNARIIEIRFNIKEIHDINNNFKLNDGTHNNIVKLSNDTKYEKLTSNKDIHPTMRGIRIKNLKYECVYMYWATDLLPHEFQFDDVHFNKDACVYYVGSAVNSLNYVMFRDLCLTHNINWAQVDPWKTPISFEENRELMKKSLLCPDFRPIGTDSDVKTYGLKNGKNHLAIGYLPCRVLKAISYGNIGITDSYFVKEILGDHVLYHSDMQTLFERAIEERTNHGRIETSMKYVQENHTYVNRAIDLIRALLQ